ncbi:MAG: ABC transporter permease [Bacteroidetes bacterium]|nr:ABC transporter permease [Bacteroidota bacterium]
MLFKLAWRNLWRNRSRSLITMASVFFAVLLAILIASLQDGVYANLIKNAVNFYTGYIQIHKKGYWDERVLDNTITKDEKTFGELKNNPDIKFISSRLESFVLASNGDKTKGCFISGIDPEKEAVMISLKDKLIEGKYFSKNDKAILIAEGLAKKLQIRLQDTLVLIGQGYHGATAAGKYPVKGILKFASFEVNDAFLFLPLNEAQILFNADNIVTSYVIIPESTETLDELKAKLGAFLGNDYEVQTWKDLLPGLDEHIRMCTADGYIFIAVLYVLVSFGIFGTLLMMMAERGKEFGMLVTIGMKRKQLGLVVLTESILITVMGSVMGAALGIPLTYYFRFNPIQLTGKLGKAYETLGFESNLASSTNGDIVVTQTTIILVIALVLSFYPLIKILGLRPEQALKK